MTTIQGATSAQQAVLREILDGLGGRIRDVHVREYEPDFEELTDLGAPRFRPARTVWSSRSS